MIKGRIASIDILRGIVICLMALDHTRDFLHQQITPDGQDFTDPTSLIKTTPILFFTRFVTHFCAPTFVMLTGLSVYLSGLRKGRKELSLFLLKRGIWLILVELLIMSFALTFDPYYRLILLGVIWVIGWGMIILGLMIWLPYKAILLTGLVLFFGHNALDQIPMPDDVKNSPAGMMLYYSYRFFIPLGPEHSLGVSYALLPWLGVMLLGYCLGRLFEADVAFSKRRRMLVQLGLGLLIFFVIFRYFNVYGDQRPWEVQPRGSIYTFLSFFNLTKYPASVLFCSVTLGGSLLALAFLEGVRNRFTGWMNVFGRVPFFFYIVHFYVLHLVTVLVFFLQGYGVEDMVPEGIPLMFRPASLGFPLWGVYVAWLLLLIVLYPLCNWYNRYKSRHVHWWLSYL